MGSPCCLVAYYFLEPVLGPVPLTGLTPPVGLFPEPPVPGLVILVGMMIASELRRTMTSISVRRS